MPSESSLMAGTDDFDRPPGYPFRGPGLLVRVAPFAAVAALAEASLALTPGPAAAAAVAVSLVLLLAVAAAFALPWGVLPGWLSVLMPLAYTGSVLALILAAGTASGVGIVILVPLIWTACSTAGGSPAASWRRSSPSRWSSRSRQWPRRAA